MKHCFRLLLFTILVTPIATGRPDQAPAGPAGVEADPAATKLLAAARAARARWVNFPGFTADVEINQEGKVTRGTVKVTAEGKVRLDLPAPAAPAWVKPMLGSIVGHRLDDSAGLNTPCAFLDDDPSHPLGRAIRVLNDEFHSSYRIRDHQIIVVNRQMKDKRFSITVMENQLNEEKQYLPVCFVVNTWDQKTGVLQNSETHHQTWERVGKFDLPQTTTVVTALAGKLEARRLALSNYKLWSE